MVDVPGRDEFDALASEVSKQAEADLALQASVTNLVDTVAALQSTVTDLTTKVDALAAAVPAPVPTLATVQPIMADSVAQAFGVNAHLGWKTSNYANTAAVIEKILGLKVRVVRDRYTPSSAAQAQAFVTLYKAGVLAHVTLGKYGATTQADILALAQSIKANPQLFASVAGPNEPNANAATDPNWAATTVQHQAWIWQALAGIVPVVGPALKDNVPDIAADFNALFAAGIAQYEDYGDFHLYPGGPPSNRLDDRVATASAAFGGKPLYCTEGGYNTATWLGGHPVTDDEHAVYAPRHLLEMVSRGIKRFCVYELLDQDTGGAYPGNWGLVRCGSADPTTWTPKPAYYALADLIDKVSDPGPDFVPAPVALEVSGPDDVRTLTVGFRDGRTTLILWRDVVFGTEPTVVTVRTAAGEQTLSVGDAYLTINL